MNEDNTSCQCNERHVKRQKSVPVLCQLTGCQPHLSHYSAGTNHQSSLGLSFPMISKVLPYSERPEFYNRQQTRQGSWPGRRNYFHKVPNKNLPASRLSVQKSQCKSQCKNHSSMESSSVNPDLCSNPAPVNTNSSWVTLGKYLNLSELQFSYLEIEITSKSQRAAGSFWILYFLTFSSNASLSDLPPNIHIQWKH